MDFYLQNALKGFLPEQATVKMISNLEDADFLLSDVDGDDQPEIVLILEYDHKGYLVVLDRENFIWRVSFIQELNESEEKEFYFLNELDILPELMEPGKEITLEEVFHGKNDSLDFIAMVDGAKYEAVAELTKGLSRLYSVGGAAQILGWGDKALEKADAVNIQPVQAKTESNYDWVIKSPAMEIRPFPGGGPGSGPAFDNGQNDNNGQNDQNDQNDDNQSEGLQSIKLPMIKSNFKPKTSGEYFLDVSLPTDLTLIDQKVGQVKGGINNDTIRLYGKLIQPDIYESLSIFIEDSEEHSIIQIIPPVSSGLQPSFELVNFSGEKYQDIVLSFKPQMILEDRLFVFIYSFQTGNLKMIFDSRDFNESFDGVARYENDYKIMVTMSTQQRYILDISKRSINDQIYSNNGKLLHETNAVVMPLSEIEFVQYLNEKTENLVTVQEIMDPLNNNVLGYIVTTFYFSLRSGTLKLAKQEAYVQSMY
ncbi:MAG: hypothetical protein ATN31_01895 [Candidatus Epulonipiscioides saccharophilum]|nr:MAG: hypothetical protein ATN31_01895 [Epulopiscium sp. AS2M-Bin001]